MVLLTNSTGKFTIIGKKVIRNAPIPKPEKTVTASSKITKRFSCLEGKYGAIPCYIVTEEFQNSPIQKIVYSIGQKDYFIYQKNIYDSNGAKISTLAYTNVKLNPHINDSIFELPEDTQVQMPENAKEEREIITKTVSSALCSKTCHQ